MESRIESLKGKLVVSCQALPSEPLHSSFIMGRMARAAFEGGACGIRANSKEDIAEIKKNVDLPIIGIIKRDYDDSAIYITPTMKEIDELMEVCPDIIALDATDRLRPEGVALDSFFSDIKKKYPNQLLMADCSTFEECIHADQLGFDFIGTTMVGYTPESRGLKIDADDFKLLRDVLANVSHPVVCEGNINSPEKARRVLDLGSFCVVVGGSITRPQLITKKYADAVNAPGKTSSREYYICIDIGGSETKYGIINEKGDILFKSSIPTEAEKGPETWMLNVVEIVEQCKKKYDLCGICVSSTGMIDSEHGKVAFALPQVPDYTGFDIKGFLESKCQLPCKVENDVNCVAVAESLLGAAKGYSSVLCITVGTGVGGGFTVDGKLLSGATYSACEVGYIKVGDSDLEHTGSTSALCRRVEFYKSDLPGSWSGKKVFTAAAEGDSDCIKAIDIMASSIAQGLASLSYILNPEIIVLGGGIMNEESLIEKIKAYYVKDVNTIIGSSTKIEHAKFGNDAGMIGAYLNFINRE